MIRSVVEMDFDFDRIHHSLGTMKGEPMNESKKRDRLSLDYIKKLLGPMPEEMRAKHREFLQVSGRRFHDPKNRILRKLSYQVSEFYRLRKLYAKLKKRGWANPELPDR